MNITAICVFVRGHVPFTAEYVTRLRSAVSRELPGQRFVCLTDRADELPTDVETVAATPIKRIYAWWAKVQLFNPALPLTGRLLYLDLDVLVIRGLREVAEHPAPFALAPDGGSAFKPNNGLRCVKRFNSSVMTWNHGEQAHLYEDWTPFQASRLWGDQDWIGERCPDAVALPVEWFPRLSAVRAPPWPKETRVVLCKKPKNAEAVRKFPWFNEAWR